MASTVETSMSWHTLSDVIQRVRARWRLRIALHGLTIVAGAAIVLLIGSAWLMNALHFGTGSIITLRVIVYATLLALAIRYIVQPLRRKATDSQVALYLEEHSKKLDAVVVSAVDAKADDAPAFVRSPYLVGRVVDAAAAKVRAMGDGTNIETRSITTSLMSLAGMAAAVVLLMLFGPEFMRTGAHLLAAPTSSAHGNIFIGITPGNAKVARGGDQAIRAQLHGFAAGSAEIVLQRGAGAWDRIPMTALRDSGGFTIRLFDLRERTSYYVESEGIRSPTYHLDIVELPYVKNLALDLHYPAYTGLPVKTIAKGGDIAVLQGTNVQVHASTTIPVDKAWIVVDGKPKIPMTRNDDGTWTGNMTVTSSGFYKIELAGPNGDPISGSLNYTIDMLEDAAPTITFIKPGRDVGVDSLAEVFSQVEATDDYGVAHLGLHYSVNGGPEQTVSLQNGAPRTDIVAGYTFFLKSLNLKPGDIISYYAQATDNDTPKGGQVTKTDIYFVTIKPHIDYQKGKGGQGGGQQQKQPNTGELVRKQRQIVAGTFKVDRDRASIPQKTLSENITTLSLAQSQLRNQVEQIGAKLKSRGLAASDTMYQMVLDEINGAASEMQSAEGSLATQNIHPALAPEQRALQHLQRAESFNRKRQIQQGQQNQDMDQDQDQEDMPKDLANLFNLDTAQLGKQVEMQKQPPKKVDELAQKLKELAERQQREREMQEQARQRAQQQGQQQPQSSDGGENQRQIAKDAEQFAKQLEQMAQQQAKQQMGQQSGQQNGPSSGDDEKSLRSAAQQLRSAAQDMRRAATGQEPDEADKAAARLEAARQMVAQQNQMNGQNSQNPSQQLLDRAHQLMRSAQSLNDQLNQNQQGAQQQGGQQNSKQNGQQGRDQKGQQGQQSQQGQPQQSGAGMKGQSQQQQGGGQGDQQSDNQQNGSGKGRSNQQQSQQGGQPGQQQQQNGMQVPGKSSPGPSNRMSAYGDDFSGAFGMNTQQLAREFREQRESAEGLRRDVQRQGGDTKGLDQTIKEMRALEGEANEGKIASQLQNSVVEGLKAWEFAFRRNLEGPNVPRPVLDGNNDVPADYKGLVDQYYQSLSKTH